MKTVVKIALLSALLIAECFAETPIECAVNGTGKNLTITVRLRAPHPGEMVVNTPDGRTVWLQADHIPTQYPITQNFRELTTFVLDTQTQGSWFNDWGEPEVVSVFGVDGEYELLVAENVESEQGKSALFSCKFSL
jgi:hypothetical protein